MYETQGLYLIREKGIVREGSGAIQFFWGKNGRTKLYLQDFKNFLAPFLSLKHCSVENTNK